MVALKSWVDCAAAVAAKSDPYLDLVSHHYALSETDEAVAVRIVR